MSDNLRAAMDSLLGAQLGKYRLVRVLGHGGMGVVFEAIHDDIGQRAAVKVLHPDLTGNPMVARRFLNEARAVTIAQHPGLVKIFDFGQFPDGKLYILMEFLDGESLHARQTKRERRLTIADALRLGRQIASALAEAHDKGIVHRDLKPDNIFIVRDKEADGQERAKILDFGLAKILTPTPSEDGADAQGERPLRTVSGVIMGTPMYMAPEQCRGARDVDHKADVYALGIILYEMLAGRPPFLALGPGDLIAMHIMNQPPPLTQYLPGAPAGIEALLQRMLAKDPSGRPGMHEVEEALTQLQARLSGKDLQLRPRPGSDSEGLLPTVADSGTRPRRRPLVWAGLLAGAAGGVLGLVLWGDGKGAPATVTPPDLIAARTASPPPPPPDMAVRDLSTRDLAPVPEIPRTRGQQASRSGHGPHAQKGAHSVPTPGTTDAKNPAQGRPAAPPDMRGDDVEVPALH